MANEEHLAILKQGVEAWNTWREENPGVRPDLSGAELYEADLSGADLRAAYLLGGNLYKTILHKADLSGAELSGVNLRAAHLGEAKLSKTKLRKADLVGAALRSADLTKARLDSADLRWACLVEANLNGVDLTQAELTGADLSRADLTRADLKMANLGEANLKHTNLHGANLDSANLSFAKLIEANLTNANLGWVSLTQTDLSGADLTGASLDGAQLIRTNFQDADLTGCSIYGIAAWDLNLNNTIQTNLTFGRYTDSSITVDNLEVAQFIYLLLENEKIRDVIDTIGRKAVLLLGRFTDERKAILDAIRDELRRRDYLPILFDFEAPASQNLTETVSTLAHLSRFVIADITDAKSIPQELQRIVPNNPSLPVQPLILSSQYEYAMFKDFLDYHWVLMPYRYDSLEELLNSLEEKVVLPATAKAQEIEERRKAIEQELAKRGK